LDVDLSLLRYAAEHAPGQDLCVRDALPVRPDRARPLLLPKVDGVRVIKELRTFPAAESTPIITVSAMDELMHAQALAAGANLALEKPCLPDELQAAVWAFLDSDPARQKGRARSH